MQAKYEQIRYNEIITDVKKALRKYENLQELSL